jgi:hypothetical protein
VRYTQHNATNSNFRGAVGKVIDVGPMGFNIKIVEGSPSLVGKTYFEHWDLVNQNHHGVDTCRFELFNKLPPLLPITNVQDAIAWLEAAQPTKGNTQNG